jgi:hypothetical protein
MTDFLGLPVFKRLYGFGDVATLKAKTTVALVGGADARAIAGALPSHPKIKPIRGAPLVVMQSDFTSATDNGDPDKNDRRYHEVMIAVIVHGVATAAPAMFPLVLFLDDPVAMASGREFYGFPKVLAEVDLEPGRTSVRFTSYPRGVKTTSEVFRSSWDPKPGVVSRALTGASGLVLSAMKASGLDDDTTALLSGLMLSRAGEIMNIRQLPDLTNPRRASLTELTRFSSRLTDPGPITLLSDFVLDLPDEPIWSLKRRLFREGSPSTLLAFDWSITMAVTTGEVLASW